MSSIFYLIFGLAFILYFWIKKRLNYWKSRGFLQQENKVSFMNFIGYEKNKTLFEAFDEQYQKFKGKTKAVGIYSFTSPNILPIDPDLIKNILVKDFNYFHDRGMYHNKADDPLSAQLLNLDGQEWRDRRSKMSPIFTSGKMKMMFEIVNNISDEFVEVLGKNLEKSKIHEMKLWAQKFTADNIGNVAFGLNCKCIEDENSTFLKYGRRLLDLHPLEIIKYLFCSSLPQIAKFLKFRLYPKESADFFLKAFLETFEMRQSNKIKRNDFVSMLLDMRHLYTPTELAAEAFLVFAAGFETSSTLIMYTLYELAINPEMQDRLRDEVTNGIEENDGKVTYELLFGFKYLDMVVNESLRKYPPIPYLFRSAVKDYKIPGTDLVIQKDIKVVINIYSLQRDPEYFPEPSKFEPERFNDENSKKSTPFTFLPFGDGQRNCIGMRFGQMQSKMAILKLIKNFKFSPCQRTLIPMEFDQFAPFISPKGGMWLKVEKI